MNPLCSPLFGRHESANESPRRREGSVEGKAGNLFEYDITERIAPDRGLRSMGLYGNVEFPKIDGASRCVDRSSEDLPNLPRVRREVVCISAFKRPACGASIGGLFEHIGGVASSSIREDWRLIYEPGSVVAPPFSFNSRIVEVSHV